MNPICFNGDLRKLTGSNRVALSSEQRPLRHRFKKNVWDAINIEKRREYNRTSMRRMRLLRRANRVVLSEEQRRLRRRLKAMAWEAANIEKRRESSRNSKRRMRLLNGREPDPKRHKFFSLDLIRCDDQNLYNLMPSAEPNPLEVLIEKETI